MPIEFVLVETRKAPYQSALVATDWWDDNKHLHSAAHIEVARGPFVTLQQLQQLREESRHAN
jgi:hypothetical protein